MIFDNQNFVMLAKFSTHQWRTNDDVLYELNEMLLNCKEVIKNNILFWNSVYESRRMMLSEISQVDKGSIST